MSLDITRIRPYAAYDVLHNGWTVRPIELPDDPMSWIPAEWHTAAARDESAAKGIVAAYDRALEQHARAGNSAAQRNALAALTAAAERGAELFDEIHLGRKAAFSSTGQGYRDFHNFRWQAGKRSGAVTALGQIKTAHAEARKDAQTALYGKPLADSTTSLRRALGG